MSLSNTKGYCFYCGGQCNRSLRKRQLSIANKLFNFVKLSYTNAIILPVLGYSGFTIPLKSLAESQQFACTCLVRYAAPVLVSS